MKKFAALVFLFFLISFQVEVARSDANCHDACTKECCAGDVTNIDICDRVCNIKCDPDISSTRGKIYIC
ncbi:hypothetical protein ACLOJK_038809 [Asimina triloba]